MASVTLPSSLVLAHRWSWRDILAGLELGLVAPQTAVDAAVSQMEDPDPSAAIVELACCSAEDPEALLLLRRLADEEPSEAEGNGFWLYLVLRWILENRELFSDPLQTVEEVYADFDYPEIVAPFVRYMPSEEPDLGSREANEARLVDKWKSFVEQEEARFRCDDPGGNG